MEKKVELKEMALDLIEELRAMIWGPQFRLH
jgi:hypothetical protein